MAQALRQEKVDAVVSSSLRRTKGERILEEFDTRDFYAMVRKGNTELLDEINYAIDQMNAAGVTGKMRCKTNTTHTP